MTGTMSPGRRITVTFASADPDPLRRSGVQWRMTVQGVVLHAVPRSGPTNRVVGVSLCGLTADHWYYGSAGGLRRAVDRCLRCRAIAGVLR